MMPSSKALDHSEDSIHPDPNRSSSQLIADHYIAEG